MRTRPTGAAGARDLEEGARSYTGRTAPVIVAQWMLKHVQHDGRGVV